MLKLNKIKNLINCWVGIEEGVINLKNIKEQIEKLKETALRCKDKAPKGNFKCGYCKDTGFVVMEQKGMQPIIKMCICQKREILKQQWIDAGFNIIATDKNIKTFMVNNKVAKKMKEIALDYIENFESIQFDNNNSVAFLGQSGSGKTHICMAISLELIKKGFNAVYFPYREVIITLKQNILNSYKYNEEINKYKKAGLLVIDDLFKGGATEPDLRIIFEILNFRYLNRLPILLSSENYSEDLLKIDTALGSRIIEMCKNRILDIPKEENKYNERLISSGYFL